jgi:hypothetical protein
LAEACSLYEPEAFPSPDARLCYLILIHRKINPWAPLHLTEVNPYQINYYIQYMNKILQTVQALARFTSVFEYIYAHIDGILKVTFSQSGMLQTLMSVKISRFLFPVTMLSYIYYGCTKVKRNVRSEPRQLQSIRVYTIGGATWRLACTLTSESDNRWRLWYVLARISPIRSALKSQLWWAMCWKPEIYQVERDLISITFRPALGLNQPPIQRVPRLYPQGKSGRSVKHVRGRLISPWLYKGNNKLRDWKSLFTLHIPPWAPHTYDFVVLTSLTHPRKILLVVLQIGKQKKEKSKTYHHPYVLLFPKSRMLELCLHSPIRLRRVLLMHVKSVGITLNFLLPSVLRECYFIQC